MSTGFMGAWLFDTFLVTSMLMLAVLLVRRPVARHFGPSVAYALWLIPAARFLMPSLEGAPASAFEGGTALQDNVRDAILAAISEPENTTSAANHMVTAPSVDYVLIGLTLWLGGAALFFIIQMIRFASVRDELLFEATEIANINGVRVVASDQVAGPLAFGLFKRYIAVPQDFADIYSPVERELALAHEMAHHRSGDLFANLAAFILLCLSWFNPVAWLSWNAFRVDQEAACDARVLAGKCAEERAIYGRALARTAFDGMPTFAIALNSRKTIVERLRRLNMKNASTKRRLFGKVGVMAAAFTVLPLTATVVPAVVAQDQTATDTKPEAVKRDVRIIRIKRDSNTVDIVGYDGDNKDVTKVEHDGKIFIFRTDKKLTEDEIEKMINEAQRSGKAADAALADGARGMAEPERIVIKAAVDIPEIDIQEMTENCNAAGQPVTTDVVSSDGNKKARVRLVMCGRGQAKIARIEALKGLREARDEIASEKDMPEAVRKDVIEKLDQEIRNLEAQADKGS